MAGEKQDNVWPLPAFYFKVEIEDIGEIAFKEVSGMDMEAQVICLLYTSPSPRDTR